ncbi:hypothetical protein H072_2678 [Dactylellina haptotyla CBS 200.50]|uniref:C2H2-type domain-containing protein n=1 Tax=Dactylellina haptotyla (strain CBS 200.50) TaxID=1284197 RepID=S8AKC1_DACHA|nr:hypothetical protein H072_2678 [Dactylellina haptotyla CBS 200.50]
MAYPMEFSLSNASTMSSVGEDFMLYEDEYLNQPHPLDIPFPGEEGFSMFDMSNLSNTSSLEEMDPDFLNPDFFKLPSSNTRESILPNLDPLPTAYPGQDCIGNFLDPQFLPMTGNTGYPTPPSTTSNISSPYSPPTSILGTFSSASSSSSRPRRPSSNRRRPSAIVSSPPSSPLAAGASSPTGGKPGIFTCHKCNAVFTFKTNKTRHVNNRACEGKVQSSATEAGCTKEYPCPIEGCPTVIKRRKDNLAVHLKKIHGLKMEVTRQ